MENYKSGFFHVYLKGMIIAAICLLGGLVIKAGCSSNIQVIQTRVEPEVSEILDYQYTQKEDIEAPLGISHVYQFHVPKDLVHDTYLGFYLFHQYAKIYLEKECIYELKSSGELPMIQTPGYNWVTIPIYETDAGKEICVEILPSYGGMDDEETEFLLGPKSQMIIRQLKKSWIKLTLCELLIFTGIVLIVFSVYYRKKYKTGVEITAFGILSLLTGIWRYTDSRFAPFMFPEKPVFLFLVSFSTMMIGMIPLMISQRKKIPKVFYQVYVLCVSSLCFIAAIFQWAGKAELRAFIRIFHVFAIVGFIMIFISSIREWKNEKNTNKEKLNLEMISLFMLLLGAILDGYFFYIHRTVARTAFLLLALLFYIIVAAFSFMVNFKRQVQQTEQKEKELVQSRISSMMGQIRSHLVFNILNAISGMCKYDPAKADETIVCFARYLRTNIDIIDNDHPVPFDVALEHLEDYIALEQVRFGDKIRFVKKIEVSDFVLPSLILQPIVENSIRHGLLANNLSGTISLHTWKENNLIKIAISDDGVGFDPEILLEKKGSVGIKNVRLRLQYMMDGKLEIESSKGHGTTTIITVNLVSNL